MRQRDDLSISELQPPLRAPRRRGGLLARAVAMLAAGALLAAPLTALPVAAQAQPGEGQGLGTAGVSLNEILDNPRQYYGQQVTVAGEVAAILGPRSFVMLAGVFAPPAEGMIPGVETADVGEIPVVVRAEPGGPPLDVNNLMERVVRVTGTVHQFNVRAFEDRLRGDLRDSLWASFTGRPAIIASQVEPVLPELAGAVQPDQQVQAGRREPGGRPIAELGPGGAPAVVPGPDAAPVPVPGPGGAPGAVPVDDVLDNPRQFFGRQVTVSGRVGNVLGPRSFTVSDDETFPAYVYNEAIPVVSRQPITDQTGRPVDLDQFTDRNVRVTGTVFEFNLQAFEDRLGLDLDDSAWADFAGRPAIIADSVTEVARPGANR